MDDLSGWEGGAVPPSAGSWPPAVGMLLRLAADTYFPFVQANARVMAAGAGKQQKVSATVTVRMADGKCFEEKHEQPPFKCES